MLCRADRDGSKRGTPAAPAAQGPVNMGVYGIRGQAAIAERERGSRAHPSLGAWGQRIAGHGPGDVLVHRGFQRPAHKDFRGEAQGPPNAPPPREREGLSGGLRR